MFNHNMLLSFMILIKLKRNKLMLMTNYSKLSILLINKRKLLLLKNKSLQLLLLRLITHKPHMMLLINNSALPQQIEISLKKDSELHKVDLKPLKKI